ncbi:uncharacterized protein LOC129782376 [Toxorhynchites rutilus septentrionalis]|uniref:uncharacterized protein LOC129782376 n=1 Tax=Toxorhynchites rutilus septentrionalis TaxID=329112 RepID=UPI00247AA3ED|nr:uncharacterized protein LOC129782376 [Toxorhynchites rutilus septentrionalis]
MPEGNITLKMFLAFIDSHNFALQSAQPVKPRTIVSKPPVKPPYRGATTFVATNISSNCNVCSKSAHPLYQCDHRGESCRSGNCRKCGLLHHTLLHAALTPTSHAVPNSGSLAAQSLISALDAPTDFDASNVLLATVAIIVLDKQGRPHACRAVLDCASQVSFISQSFCNELGLELQEADMNLEGISATPAHADKCVPIVITSRCTDYRTTVPCMVLERITKTLPVKPANIDGWPMPHSINLADPVFHRPGKISVLLGIELFFQLLEPGKIILSPDGDLPTLQNTKLGWVVAGRYREPTISPYTRSSTCLLTTSDDNLNQQLRRFWELEECCTSTPHFSEEEKLCEDHIHKHTTRDDTGKFIVRLPFLHPPSQLGDSRQPKSEYHAFLREYCELGHMTLAEEASPRVAVYLPHHCVVKENSSTTKCRVVFDASAKTTTGKSLNDMLMCGPVLQDSIVDILLRFRFPSVRILWRWCCDDVVKEYHLNTVTYGTKSASYLATKCVQQLLEAHRKQYPVAVGKAEKNTYVDDILTGAESEKEAALLRQQLTTIFASGGFHLRKWASNNAAVLNDIPTEDREVKSSIEINESRTIKALGIHWQPRSDERHALANRQHIRPSWSAGPNHRQSEADPAAVVGTEGGLG